MTETKVFVLEGRLYSAYQRIGWKKAHCPKKSLLLC